mgnify:CR=1 FL=1
MKNYKIALQIQASSQTELEEKLQAFQDLQDHLSHEDLLQSVEVIVENPELVDFIKEVAPQDGQELSISDYLSIAQKAYKKFS